MNQVLRVGLFQNKIPFNLSRRLNTIIVRLHEYYGDKEGRELLARNSFYLYQKAVAVKTKCNLNES